VFEAREMKRVGTAVVPIQVVNILTMKINILADPSRNQCSSVHMLLCEMNGGLPDRLQPA
jgi:hypothetical protein